MRSNGVGQWVYFPEATAHLDADGPDYKAVAFRAAVLAATEGKGTMNTFYVMQNVYVVTLPGARAEFRLFLDPVEARNFFLDNEHTDMFSFSVYQTQDGGIDRSNMTRMEALAAAIKGEQG